MNERKRKAIARQKWTRKNRAAKRREAAAADGRILESRRSSAPLLD